MPGARAGTHPGPDHRSSSSSRCLQPALGLTHGPTARRSRQARSAGGHPGAVRAAGQGRGMAPLPPDAWVSPTAVVRGDVTVGPGSRILDLAVLHGELGPIVI